MEERDNKTIICSVLFLDIVEYSQKNVSGQIALKEGFNVFLSTALAEIPVEDRIILDTGDGAAISFLGDVEDALKVGLSMRHSLMTAGIYMDTPLLVRMGINLGPVRLVKDINNQPNIVGDGINVAQRIMGFADAGQLLVSRSYYDAVSRISQEYAGMFHYQGSRTDKHVREHEIYAIGYPGEFTMASMRGSAAEKIKYAVNTVKDGMVGIFDRALEKFRGASVQLKALYLGVPLLLVLIAVIAIVMQRGAPDAQKKQVVRYYPESQPAEPVKIATVTPKKSEPAVAGKAPVKTADKPSIARVRTVEETVGKAAVINLMVVPWGEVYLDGRKQGVSPPLLEMQVVPGAHEVEIRNGNFPAYKQKITVKVGQKIKISHKFGS